LGLAHGLLLAVVQVAEVEAPEQEFLFGDFFPEALEGVAEFFGDGQA